MIHTTTERWRELYPEENLAEIRELALCRKSKLKLRYVWTIHPFRQPHPLWY